MSHTASWLARGPVIALVIVTVLVTGGMAWAQDAEPTPRRRRSGRSGQGLTTKIGDLKVAADTMWVLSPRSSSFS